MISIKKAGILFSLIGLLSSIQSPAQSKLKPGDSLTGVFFETMVNHYQPRLHVDKDLAGKLVIFDNWGQTCYPCVQGLPKLDTLQKLFGDKIQILPWTEDPKSVVEKIYARINSKYNMIIPSAAEATRHDNIGTTANNYTSKIWWYNGKVVAVTPTKFVNEKNIRQFLDHGYLNLDEKTEFPGIKDFPKSKLTDNILYQKEKSGITVKITQGIPNVKAGVGYSTSSSEFIGMGARFINYSFRQLYMLAFGTGKFVTDLDPILKKRFQDQKVENAVENAYCVELIGDSVAGYYQALDEAKKMLQVGLAKTFGVTAVKENRKVKSYVLKEILGNDRFKSTTNGEELWDKTAFYLHVENLPADRAFKAITSKLTWGSDIDYVTNELDYSGNVSLNITASTYDYNSMKSALAEYGLDLSIGEREKEVWVIKNIEN